MYVKLKKNYSDNLCLGMLNSTKLLSYTSNEACAVILSLCPTGIISNKTVETFCVFILNYPTLSKVTLAQKVC